MDKWLNNYSVEGELREPKLDLGMGSKLGISVGHSPSSRNVLF